MQVAWAASARRDRIVYRVRASRVIVLVVLDARRSLEDILIDRLIKIEGQEL
jgi:hypothetical protein